MSQSNPAIQDIDEVNIAVTHEVDESHHRGKSEVW